MSKPGAEAVKVVVRMRPFNGREKELKCGKVVDVDGDEAQISITKPGRNDAADLKTFKYDAVYDWDSTQRAVYDETAMPLVESVMEGFNGTIFAYGQTGCGKTFTMEGMPEPPELRGIIPNAFEHIFEIIASDTSGKKYLVRAMYLEIYNEEIRDLLGSNPTSKLELKEDPQKGVFVKDLTSAVVKNSNEIDSVMQAGNVNRTTGATLMNAVSSRSHSIFTVIIERSEQIAEDKSKDGGAKKKENRESVRRGKLNLVDLAGSERQSKTQASGQRLKEATKINLSLSALGNVISALVDGRSSHIPYRDSKLTRLLQDSLGGNTKTVMVAAISPADNNYDETLSTLRYAHRAKNIKNKPKINEDPKDAMLREFQDEIKRLREALAAQAGGGGGAGAALFASVAMGVASGGISVPDSNAGAIAQGESGGGEGLGNQVVSASDIIKQQEQMAARIKEIEELRVQKEELESQSTNWKEMAQVQRDELEARKKEIEAKQRDFMKREQEIEDERRKREEAQAKALSIEEALNARQAMFSEAEERIKAAEAAKLLERRKTRRAKYIIKKKQEEAYKEADYLAEMKEMVEDDLATTQANLTRAKRYIKKLRADVESERSEIVDLQQEFEREREGHLDTIRDQQRELTLFEQIVELWVPPAIMQKIEEKAMWNEENSEWTIPRDCVPQYRLESEPLNLPNMSISLVPSPNARAGSVLPGPDREKDRDREKGKSRFDEMKLEVGHEPKRSVSAAPSRPHTAESRRNNMDISNQASAIPVQLLVEEKTRKRRDSITSLSKPSSALKRPGQRAGMGMKSVGSPLAAANRNRTPNPNRERENSGSGSKPGMTDLSDAPSLF